jgi:hypothetical protein
MEEISLLPSPTCRGKLQRYSQRPLTLTYVGKTGESEMCPKRACSVPGTGHEAQGEIVATEVDRGAELITGEDETGDATIAEEEEDRL